LYLRFDHLKEKGYPVKIFNIATYQSQGMSIKQERRSKGWEE
jgi:hypothetical protein